MSGWRYDHPVTRIISTFTLLSLQGPRTVCFRCLTVVYLLKGQRPGTESFRCQPALKERQLPGTAHFLWYPFEGQRSGTAQLLCKEGKDRVQPTSSGVFS